MTSSYISATLRQQVYADAGQRCGYCLSPEILLGTSLEIEHLIPQAAGGLSNRDNLWLACRRCNQFKGSLTEAIDPQTGERVALFNPRRQDWFAHFVWQPDGTQVKGITPCGRATVVALQLNHDYIVETRSFWVEVGWWPPNS